MMKMKFSISLLAILILSSSQSLYAHGEDSGFEQRKTERKQVSEEKDQDTWNDFMRSVKEQETESASTEKTLEKEQAHDHNQ